PALPAALGFDPRLQLLHLEDAATAVLRAAEEGMTGVHNVAGTGVVLLSQAAARLGRPLLPVLSPVGEPAPLAGLSRLAGYGLAGQRSALLRHGRVLDTRSAERTLGFRARATTASLDSLVNSLQRAGALFGDLEEPELERLLLAKGRGRRR
ncbi:MAG: hypothetical protein M3010_01805, partial [Candidatus Dormibacteraeota bacterium]|nr:hypothetical protein [Candidatus Dormibacteraeota bacterium]